MEFGKKLSLFIFLLLLPLANVSIAQNSLDKDKWEEITKDMDYGDIKNPEPEEEEEEESDEDSGFELPEGLVQVLIISALVIGLTLLLIRILSNRFNNEKIEEKKQVESLEDAEAELENSDLLPLLDRLLSSENYRLALRILYLRILQELHRQEYIDWRKEKTNFDYVNEIHDGEKRSSLASLTLKFEQKWYGEQEISSEEFNELRPEFESYLIKLTGNE